MTHPQAFTRRQVFGAGGGVIGLALLAACGGGGDAEADVDGAAAAGSGFPVSIPHAFGSLELKARPERVVVVGFKEADALLALGVVPVGIREWFGEQPNAVWPWATKYLGGAKPTVLERLELNFEKIASLSPDLIVGLSAGLKQEDYDTLSKIAPTLAQPGAAGDYTITWQQITRSAGLVAGRKDDAEKMVTDLEARLAQVPTDHPTFKGATAVNASAVGGEVYLYSPGATSSKLLTDLGFTMSDEIAKLTDNENGYYVVSQERLDLLDVDLAVFGEAATDDGPKTLVKNPVYEKLAVRTERRELFLGLEWNGALQYSSVLSLGLVLDELVPQMVLAADGDPATTSELGAA